MNAQELTDRVRAICLRLPEVTERLSHGAPAFFAGKQFVQLWPDGHHDHDFPHLWCAAPVGLQEELVAADPDRFFRPPYVGHRGWVGVRLDAEVDWDEVAEAVRGRVPGRGAPSFGEGPRQTGLKRPWAARLPAPRVPVSARCVNGVESEGGCGELLLPGDELMPIAVG